jgi:beta-lactamase superfamily II metal-dependent hydrolase
MFKLEAMSAKHGDALLLHYGAGAAAKLVLIDAGPAGVWKSTVRKRLEQIRMQRNVPRLPLRMVMVSHVDADHVTGVVDLFKELHRARTNGDPLAWDVATLWHNSFKAALRHAGAAAPAQVNAAVAVASLDTVALPAALARDRELAADLASVAQGNRLSADAAALGVAVNDAFGGGLVMAPASGAKKVTIGNGLTFTVIGPSQARLDALEKEWKKKTKARKATPAEVAAYVDASVYNLSSIVVLAAMGRKRMLLTGDARGDDVLAGLAAAKLLKNGTLHVDLLKVPHHGSDRNVEPAFFESVTADHYVISADGKYGNPDVGMLAMLTEARGHARYTIWLTNQPARVKSFFTKDRKKGRRYTVEVRRSTALSLEVEP